MLAEAPGVRHALPSRALLGCCLVLGACWLEYPESDKVIVRRWLKCEECVHKELDAVRAAGDRIVPLLREALKGPTAQRTENVTRQLRDTYGRLQGRYTTLSVEQGQFVRHYLSNYKALYQSRAITGLAAIGTDKARGALKAAAQQAPQLSDPYRADVRDELTRAAAGRWTAISAGLLRTCGIRTDGKSYCWGQNDLGQLGDSTTQGRLKPAPIAGNHHFASIVTGIGWHTCGIDTKRAYCWGSNARGELGDGSTRNRIVPTEVAGGNTFNGVIVGGNHTCAWTPGNRGYCWGGNNAGQVGDGSTTDRFQPILVTSNLGLSSVHAGAMHTCADSLNDVVHCWGLNTDGQLGDNSTTDQLTPGQAVGPVRARSISVGASHGCVVSRAVATTPAIADGTAYCVGNNGDGRLGDGSNISRDSLVRVTGGNSFLSVSAGERHTCGILKGTRALRCWGDNEFGQLGDGTTTDRSAPVSVVLDSLTFATVSAGAGHTCALTTDGEAYCWGLNAAGQLGDSTTTNRLMPAPVTSP